MSGRTSPGATNLAPSRGVVALRRREEWLLFAAGAAVNLGGVLAATCVATDPSLSGALVLLTLVGLPASLWFRRLRLRRFPVNLGIVLATVAFIAVYLYQSPWLSMFHRQGLGRGLLTLNMRTTYSLLIELIAVLTAFRTFGLLGNVDVVLSILPALSIVVLVAVLAPRQQVLPSYLLFALGSVVALLAQRRLQFLSLPRQLGSDRAHRRSLVLSLRALVVLILLSSAGAYGITALMGHYQPRAGWLDQYGLQLARYVADAMTQAAEGVRVATTDFVDLATARATVRNAVLFEVRAPRAAYWRTSTVDWYTGASWERHTDRARTILTYSAGVWLRPDLEAEFHTTGRLPHGGLLKQTITARAPLLIALPCAFEPIWIKGDFRRVRVAADGRVQSLQVVSPGESYTVVSRLPVRSPRAAVPPLTQPERYLALPAASPKIARLARRVTQGAATPREKVERLTRYLRGHYQYTLRPNIPGQTPDVASYFLFRSHRGYCVHFATALAVCLRTLHIPARVALGYLPGEWDPDRQVFVVRQHDAHAWVEAYLPDGGWMPFDATPAGAPAAERAPSCWVRLLDALGGAVEWFVGVDWTAGARYAGAGVGALFLGVIVVVSLLRSRVRRVAVLPKSSSGGQQDAWRLAVAHVYWRVVRRVSASVVPRSPTNTPAEYAARVAAENPAVGLPFQTLSNLYAECRYSSHRFGARHLEIAAGSADRTERHLRPRWRKRLLRR